MVHTSQDLFKESVVMLGCCDRPSVSTPVTTAFNSVTSDRHSATKIVTPPQSPTRSVSRRCLTLSDKWTAKEKKMLLTWSQIKPNTYPLTEAALEQVSYKEEDSLMAQYGIHEKIRVGKVHYYNILKNAPISKSGSRRANWQCLGYTIALVILMILCGFLGGICYMYVEHYYLGFYQCSALDVQPTAIAPLDSFSPSQMDQKVHQLTETLQQLTEEVRDLREYISRTQERYSDVAPKPERGILEELFTPEPDLVSSGNLGIVLSTPGTTTFTVPTYFSVLGVMSFSVDMYHRPPHTTIKGLIQEIGDCWAFSGKRGRLVLKLHRPSFLSSVSISHIPLTISPFGNIATAPRHFVVLAHQTAEDLENGLLLGKFEYSSSGPWRQTFQIDTLVANEELITIVEFRFLSNHGNPNYTCVYRVHVHGKMV